MCREKRNKHKYIYKKLENMRYSLPMEFWKLFKKDKNNAGDEIELEDLEIISPAAWKDSDIAHDDAELFCEQTF